GVESLDHLLRKRMCQFLIKKNSRFLGGEAQIKGCDVLDISSGAPACEWEWGIIAADKYQMQRRGQMFNKKGQSCMNIWFVDHMVVVQDQQSFARQPVQFIEPGSQDIDHRWLLGSSEQGQGGLPEFGLEALAGSYHIAPELH